MTSDPPRLLEDPSATASLRSDLAHAAEAEVQGLDLAAGLAALRTATTASSGTALGGTSLLVKVGVGSGLVAGAVALWLGWGRTDPPRPEAEPVEVVVAAHDDEAALVEPEAAPQQAAHDDEAAPVEPEAAPVEAAPVEAAPMEPAPQEPEASALEASEEPRPALGRRRAERASAPKATKPSSMDDDVLREAMLVAKARSHLARDPARALALAEEAERDFPRGQLVEERRALAIRALVALGRLDEAQRQAEPFLAEHGRGAHAAAVRRALEGSP